MELSELAAAGRLLPLLSEAAAPPGHEGPVRDILRRHLAGLEGVRLETDSLGNLYAWRGEDRPGPRVMLAAHMDEVGLIVSHLEESGLLRCKPLGGIDPRVLPGKEVRVGRGERARPGVIGAPPPHRQKSADKDRVIPWEELFIDIGAASREEAAEHVHLGDPASFVTRFACWGEDRVLGKAFDDRVGCALLAELLGQDWPFPLCGAFTVQEEVGLRGAAVAARRVRPDLALVLEGTTCADLPGIPEERWSTSLGAGPAITVADSTLVVPAELLHQLTEVAGQEGIPWQWKRTTAGGTDAGPIQRAEGGVPVAVVSVPCRYLHAPVSVASLHDIAGALRLARAFLARVAEGWRPGQP